MARQIEPIMKRSIGDRAEKPEANAKSLRLAVLLDGPAPQSA